MLGGVGKKKKKDGKKKRGKASISMVESEEDRVKKAISSMLERNPENFNMIVIRHEFEEQLETTEAPYTAASQEITRMNALLDIIRTSLIELQKGLQGDLNMSERMDDLYDALRIGQVQVEPFHRTSWEKVGVVVEEAAE